MTTCATGLPARGDPRELNSNRYIYVDRHLTIAADTARNVKVRRWLLQYAATELERIGTWNCRREYSRKPQRDASVEILNGEMTSLDMTVATVDVLLERSGDTVVPPHWITRCKQLVELWLDVERDSESNSGASVRARLLKTAAVLSERVGEQECQTCSSLNAGLERVKIQAIDAPVGIQP